MRPAARQLVRGVGMAIFAVITAPLVIVGVLLWSLSELGEVTWSLLRRGLGRREP